MKYIVDLLSQREKKVRLPNKSGHVNNLETTEFLVSITDRSKVKRILITVHGIRDEAYWNAMINEVLKIEGFDCEVCPTRYPRYSTFPFILGIGKSKIEKKVYDELKYYSENYPECPIDLICHSNGTSIICNVLKSIDKNFNNIVFIGSICKRDDVKLIMSKAKYIINDCGIKDRWPVLAKSIRPDLFDNTGVIGIQLGGVNDRFFDFGHSGGVSKDHMRNFILPILVSGDLKIVKEISPDTRWHNPTYYRILFLLILLILLSIVFLFTF